MIRYLLEMALILLYDYENDEAVPSGAALFFCRGLAFLSPVSYF
jgi:hypothetical protein